MGLALHCVSAWDAVGKAVTDSTMFNVIASHLIGQSVCCFAGDIRTVSLCEHWCNLKSGFKAMIILPCRLQNSSILLHAMERRFGPLTVQMSHPFPFQDLKAYQVQ